MARFEIRKRSQGEKKVPVPHDRLWAGRWTGWIELELETVEGRRTGVIPGTGRFGTAVPEGGGSEIAVERSARRGGTPVLPGTGIKGAVRTLFELATGSCDLLSPGACRMSRTRIEVCPACRLFGLLGYEGRIGFLDAVAAGDDAVEVVVRRVPVAWTPGPGEDRVYRLFDGRGITEREGEAARPEVVPVEVYRGRFRSRMTLRNVESVELGLVLAVMGLGEKTFPLRMGAKKFDGWGAVRFAIREACFLRIESGRVSRERWSAESAAGRAAEVVREALSSSPSARAMIDQIAERLPVGVA